MIRLYNDDCIKILKGLKSESIDLVVTDPPYRTISGGNKTSKWKAGWATSVLSRNDGKIFDYNDVNHYEWIKEVYRVLKPNTHFYMMTNVLNMFELKQIAESVGFVLHNVLVWKKNNCVMNRWYMKNCEYTLFFRKGTAKTINKPNSTTVHCFNNPTDKTHPTEKPVELMKYYIENSSNVGDLVLDPFMGTGATIKACDILKRNCIGIEIDKKYFDIVYKWSSECNEINETLETISTECLHKLKKKLL